MTLTHKRGVSDSEAIAFAKGATEHRGAANRTHRNMVVYLAGDRDRIEELERSVREYLGWSEILAKEDDLNLTTNQKNQATERRTRASETTDARLLGAYQWALVPTGQPIEIQATKVEGQASSSAHRSLFGASEPQVVTTRASSPGCAASGTANGFGPSSGPSSRTTSTSRSHTWSSQRPTRPGQRSASCISVVSGREGWRYTWSGRRISTKGSHPSAF